MAYQIARFLVTVSDLQAYYRVLYFVTDRCDAMS